MTSFGALEQQRAEILEALADWSATRLSYKATLKAWSASEVIDHLVKLESEIVAAAMRSTTNSHPIRVRDRIGFFLLERLFRTDRRVRVPAATAEVLPEPDVDLVDVVQRWEITRRDLSELLALTSQVKGDAGVFRHPVSGWMTIPQIARLLYVHVQHHRYQLTRLSVASEGL